MYKYGIVNLEFEWDLSKDVLNQKKHGIGFLDATKSFADPEGIVLSDVGHSKQEKRFYWVGRLGSRVITTWYTRRDAVIRIIGAAELRKMRKLYEAAKL